MGRAGQAGRDSASVQAIDAVEAVASTAKKKKKHRPENDLRQHEDILYGISVVNKFGLRPFCSSLADADRSHTSARNANNVHSLALPLRDSRPRLMSAFRPDRHTQADVQDEGSY